MYSIPNYTKGWLSWMNGFNMFFGFVWDFMFSLAFLCIVIDKFDNWERMCVAISIVCLLYAAIAAGSISIGVFLHSKVGGCGLESVSGSESDPPSTSFACKYNDEEKTCSPAPGSLPCTEVPTEVYYNIESFKKIDLAFFTLMCRRVAQA